MSIPIYGDLRERLVSRFPASVVDEHLAAFPAEYFGKFDQEALERHLGLLTELTDERPVLVRARPAPAGGRAWEVQVVGFDSFQFLSTACMLMAVHELAVDEGHVFTSEPPTSVPVVAGPARARAHHPFRPRRSSFEDMTSYYRPTRARASSLRRQIVDVFRVESIGAAAGTPDWGAIEAELTELTQLLRHGEHEKAQGRLIHRFAARLEHLAPESSWRGLPPIEVEIDPAAAADSALVRVVARDSFGFLSLTASALSLCGLRVARAEIGTAGDGRVDDSFWVTDRGGKKVEDEAKLRSLRSTLILVEHFSSRLHRASDPESALVHFTRFAAETMARPDWDAGFAALDRPEVLDAFAQVLGESRFLWEDYLLAQPENILPLAYDPAGWSSRKGKEALAADLAADLMIARAGAPRARALQLFRDREIFRTDVRTILGLTGGLEGFSAELSDVAEVITPAALALAAEDLGPAPTRADGTAVPAALMSLGKFGGRELGFASDLELMLVYDDRDVADPGQWSGPAEYFDRLAGSLRKVLEARQGATFDLDFRLRPYGKSGAPAVPLTLFESYFAPEGPAWAYERQALIKLRAVAGDEVLGAGVESLRDQFVYRGVWPDPDERQRLRAMQIRQLTRPGRINAKFSPGALVEVEYLVQTLQIRYGDADAAIRSPNTLAALAALEAAGHLGPEAARVLRDGYRFFRAVVSALRVVHGHAKDLVVPEEGTQEFQLLTRRLRRSLPVRFVAQARENLGRLLGEQIRAISEVAREVDERSRSESGPTGV